MAKGRQETVKNTNNRKLDVCDYILLIVAVICIFLTILPYSVYKKLGDGFASDGNMERLTPQYVLIFRLSMGMLLILILGLFFWKIIDWDGRKRFFKSVWALPGRCWHDIKPFFHDLGTAMKPDGIQFWLFLLIFIAGVIVRILHLNDPLMHDEAYSMAIWGRSDLLFAISDYHLPNNHVFHSVLVNLVYHHIGKTVPLLRMPVFISGCLLIIAVWLVGKLFYNDYIALAAAGLTAFAPFLISYSYNARGYEIQALFSVMTFGLAVYGKRKQNIFSWILLILFSALNFFTLPIALYPFGGICVWLLLNVIFFDSENAKWRSRCQLMKYLIFMGISVTVITMLLYTPLLRYSGWNSFFGNIYIGGTEAATYTETMISRLKDNIDAFFGTWPITVVYFITIGVILSIVMFRKNAKEKISYGLALLLWMGILIPFQKPNLWPRTLLFMHPFLLLFASSGIYGLKRISKLNVVITVVFPIIILIAGISQFQFERKISPDEKAVQVILAEEGKNADNVHLATAAQDNAPLWIYADAYGLPRKIFDKNAAFNTVYAFVNPLNDSYLGPKTLDDLLERFGPGNNFIDMKSAKILIDEPYCILYRFDCHESAVIKAFGYFPEVMK